MSAQPLSEKNTRKMAKALGLPIERVLVKNDWADCRLEGDVHVIVDRKTMTVVGPGTMHWTSCP
jgi:hypothetical protein